MPMGSVHTFPTVILLSLLLVVGMTGCSEAAIGHRGAFSDDASVLPPDDAGEHEESVYDGSHPHFDADASEPTDEEPPDEEPPSDEEPPHEPELGPP
jgi:hypothetical protein